MNYIILLFLSFLLYWINYFFFKKFHKFLDKIDIIDKNFVKPQSFHTSPTPRIGGFLLIFNIVFLCIFAKFFFNTNYYVFIFAVPFFFIGFIDDTKVIENPKFRLIILISIIVTFLFFSNLNLENTGFSLINYFLSNYILFKIIFLLFCFLTIINGSNFIDGFNGLLTIHSLIILMILGFMNYDNDLFPKILIVILSLIIFLLFNFPKAKMFLGDSGAYIIGFLISYFVIETSIQNNNVSPIFFCILLFYLFFEVLFSFCRKKLSNISPLHPDKKHLHMVLFRILNTKIFNNKLKSNYFTSVSINITYMVMISPTFFIYDNGFLCKLYFITLICIYLLIYFNLRKYDKKEN